VKGRGKAIGFGGLIVAAIGVGCGVFLDLDEDTPSSPAPPPVEAAAPVLPVAPDAACGQNPLDLEGCPCNLGERPNPCFHGSPSNNSTCANGGNQTCNASPDGLARWSKCEGGTFPRDAGEICFNNVDEDCDGLVDQGCGVCSDDVDLCKPLQDAGAPPFAARHTCFTIPARPMPNQDVDIYIVSQSPLARKEGAIDGVCNVLLKDPEPCFSPGRGCKGWSIRHVGKRSFPTAKSYRIDMYRTFSPPCTTEVEFTCTFSVYDQ